MISQLSIRYLHDDLTHYIQVPTSRENLPYNLASAFAEIIRRSGANDKLVIEQLVIELQTDIQV